MGVPSLTYTLKRGTSTIIPEHAGQAIANDAKVSFNAGYNQVIITYTASESLNRIECRCTFEGNDYGIGVGSLLYENYGSVDTSGTITLNITPETFTWGDGLYRIGFYAKSQSTEEWNFQYFFLTSDGECVILVPEEGLPASIDDLTGYTWLAKDTLAAGNAATRNLIFTDEIDYWTSLITRPITGGWEMAYANDNVELVVYNSVTGWKNQSHKVIEISGGTDVKNTNLITYLEANGDLGKDILKVQAVGDMGTSIALLNENTAFAGQVTDPVQNGNTLSL